MPCNHGRGIRLDIGCMDPAVLDAAADRAGDRAEVVAGDPNRSLRWAATDPSTDAIAMRVG